MIQLHMNVTRTAYLVDFKLYPEWSHVCTTHRSQVIVISCLNDYWSLLTRFPVSYVALSNNANESDIKHICVHT